MHLTNRMRALSFSLIRELESDVDDTDQNLKELVVPLEHRDLCGGNLRYLRLLLLMCSLGIWVVGISGTYAYLY